MGRRIGRMAAVFLLGVLLMLGSLYTKEMTPASLDGTAIEGWRIHADEPVTLDWYINFSWYTTTWGGNLVSDTITEETGVDINFIVPSGNESEKLSALIASNALPDMITLGFWEPAVNEMIENDMVYALNELGEQYDAYFFEVTDPDTTEWFTRDDGNIYSYPNSSYTPKDLEENDSISANQNFLVRKDIYEAIGSPDMTTQEGFYYAIKKAVEMFPEVDGKPLIPIGAHVFKNEGCTSFDDYLMNFLAVPYEKDGQYYDRYTDPEYISWLKFFRQLGEEGYLAQDIFIDQRMQMNEKLEEGRYFCMLYQSTDMAAQQKALYAKNPDSIYMAIDGPKNSNGDDYQLPCTGINGWTVTLISKNCERPDRAIQFLDYLMSEHGQMLTYLGVEGVTYDIIDGKAIVRDDVLELLNTDRKEYDRIYGANDAYWMMQDNVMQLQWKQKPMEPMAQLQEWTYPYVIYNGQYDSLIPSKSHYINADNRIKELWGKTLPRLLLAQSEEEFDRIFENFIEERDALGYAELQKENTRLMENAKEKLGIK